MDAPTLWLILVGLAIAFVALSASQRPPLANAVFLAGFIYVLGLPQSAVAPLSLASIPAVSIGALALLVILGWLGQSHSSSRKDDREAPTNAPNPRGGLTGRLMVIAGIWGAATLIFGDASSSQWVVYLRYIAPFALIFVMPPKYCRHLLAATAAGVVVITLIGVIQQDRISTLSGVSQLSAGIQPNIFALCASVAALVLLDIYFRWQAGTPRVLALVGAAIALYAVVAAVSRTGLLALSITGVMLIVKHRFDSSWPRVLMTATVAAGVTLAFLGIFVPAFREWFVRGDSESLSSLTGRTHIWQVLIEASLDRPLVGYGFGALYNEAFTGGSLLREIPGTNAHNMLLQACVETGVIGLALIVSVIFVAGRSLAKRARGPLAFTLLLLLCLNGLGSAGIATVGIAAWLLAMLVYVARSTSHPYRAHVVEEWKAR